MRKAGILFILCGIVIIFTEFNYYKLITPQYVIRDLEKNGWKYEIDKNMSNPFGYTDIKNKIIKAKNYRILLHELGHYIDIKCGNVSQTDEFLKIYNLEKEKSEFDEYYKFTPREYFAETYENMLENNLKSGESVEYIKQVIKGCFVQN